MQFEWDEQKALINQHKHGISFEEAKSCFYDPNQIAFYDSQHSDDEDREILIGHSQDEAPAQVSVNLLLDKEVVDFFQQAAAQPNALPYQVQINQMLRELIHARQQTANAV